MVRVEYVLPDGSHRLVEARPGMTVMSVAIERSIPGIEGECGGAAACATCHVYVDEAWAARLSPPEEHEAEMLEHVEAERRPTSRLGCQIKLTPELDNIVVSVPG